MELKDNRTLLVTAMSDLRMRVLLDLLQEIAGDILGEPQMERDPVPAIDKRTRKPRGRAAERKQRRRW